MITEEIVIFLEMLIVTHARVSALSLGGRPRAVLRSQSALELFCAAMGNMRCVSVPCVEQQAILLINKGLFSTKILQ